MWNNLMAQTWVEFSPSLSPSISGLEVNALLKIYFHFTYKHFACVYICVLHVCNTYGKKILRLELQMIVRCWECNPGPAEEQPILLMDCTFSLDPGR